MLLSFKRLSGTMSFLQLQFCASILWLSLRPTHAVVVHLDQANLDSVLNGVEVVFVNFYADWCRFSQMLTPIFEEASNKFTERQQQVTFASVDCDRHNDVAAKYHINKYPTLKLFRQGELVKREYRGQRSVEAISEFIEQQLIPSFRDLASVEELQTRLEGKKRNVIAYFSTKSGQEWTNFAKIAGSLKEECDFWVGSGDVFQHQTVSGPKMLFRPPHTSEDQSFSGNMADAEFLKQWITDKCIPLVREITFENAEELTEEGLPFLILFRHPDDNAIVETYTQEIARQLTDQKTAVNFLYADGKKFAHPLHHLGKTERDLPILAIDSFRHMYIFPDIKELTVPGKLRQFILDLHSGKLHREFHHGPDPTQPPDPSPPAIVPGPDGQPMVVQPPASPTHEEPQRTSPPESTFKKLKPSQTRYTILKDEL